tara:strand:- start:1216 stop:1725 length:510 start_codon:yes stop_codon:yes gene_type:complete
MKIAICGKMCSGKTSLAKYIQKSESRFKILSYGQKVKDISTELFNMTKKDRTLIINVASKMREINPDVWSNYILKQSKELEYCIIDDLRFQNELDGLMNDECDWIFIKLNISKEIQEKRIKLLYPDNYQDHIKNNKHLSEQLNLDFKDKKVIHIDSHNELDYKDILNQL